MSSGIYTIAGKQPTLVQPQTTADQTQLINLSTTERVWYSSNPGMQPGYGTPVEPLASVGIPKLNGPLYVMCADGPPASAQIIVTDEALNYDNPIALASAVAAQLVTSGLPLTYKEVALATNQAVTGNITFDVSLYQSVVIDCVSPASTYTFTDNAGNIVDADTLTSQPTRLAVVGTKLVISTGTNGNTITVLASNRPALIRYDMRKNYRSASRWIISSRTWAIGDETQFSRLDADVYHHGLCYITCASSLTKWQIYIFNGGLNVILADSSEGITDSGGGVRVNKLIAMPTGWEDNILLFNARSTGTSSPNLTVTPAYI